MRMWIKPVLFGLFVALLAHLSAIAAIPNGIMSIAMARIAQTSGGVNALYHSPAITPQNQTIVRPSPDLAYSTCALDLSRGPVRIFIGKGQDYASAAFYSANTDNVFTLSDADIPAEGARLLLVSARSPIQAQPGERVISLTSDKGLMLVRRLAPTAQDFVRIEQERKADRCAPVQ